MPGVPSVREALRFLRRIAIGPARPDGRADVPGPCWLWTAARDPNGYGFLKWRGRKVWAHRFAFTFFIGPIPAGFQVHHECYCASCVNPAHLTLLTHAQNAALKRARRSE